jgi:uncharacterized DUF497 family protein
MQFDWDPAKRETNLAKHGVDLADAAQLDWDNAKAFPDTRRAYGEPRFIAYGTLHGVLHVVAYTRRGSLYRVISLRRANRREIARYGTA